MQWETIGGFQAGNDVIQHVSFKDLSGCGEKGLEEGADSFADVDKSVQTE